MPDHSQEIRPLIEAQDLVKYYPLRGGVLLKEIASVKAVDHVSLAIGNGETLGLGPDLKSLRKPNIDGFENVLNMAFNKMIGAEFRQYVDVTFPNIDGETICLVTVRPSSEPVYMVHKGTEKFYIRAGNASQPLSMSKATKYIQSHFTGQ